MTDDIQRGSRGPAPSWNLGRTRTITVPMAIASRLMEIARSMDRGELIEASVLFARELTHSLFFVAIA